MDEDSQARRDQETPLSGGHSTPGVVRIGTTVRRPLTANSAFVHRVLRRLEEAAVMGAPRLAGIDDRGREILTFINGKTGHDLRRPGDEQLVSLASLVRSYHDALAGSHLAADQETVCHNDLAPWNLILRDGVPIAFIDFDDAAPGRRCDDVGYLLWVFLELGGRSVGVAEQARGIRLFCDAYETRRTTELHSRVLSGVRRSQARILRMRCRQAQTAGDHEVRTFASDRAMSIRSDLEWERHHRVTLTKILLRS